MRYEPLSSWSGTRGLGVAVFSVQVPRLTCARIQLIHAADAHANRARSERRQSTAPEHHHGQAYVDGTVHGQRVAAAKAQRQPAPN